MKNGTHEQGRQKLWYENNEWSATLHLMQIETQDITYPVYFNTGYHLSKSKQTIPLSEISKTIPLAEICHKSQTGYRNTSKVPGQHHY